MAKVLFCSSALVAPLSSLSSASLSITSGSGSQWKPAFGPFSGKGIAGTKSWAPSSLRVRAIAQKQKRETGVETPDITTPPLPGGTTPSEAGSEQEGASSSGPDGMEGGEATEVEAVAQDQKQLTPEEIGQQLKAIRISRGEVSTSPQDFWGGVWEETKLVEWPQFQKVLGTTGVVVGIIFGSSILLLTVNAILAELSDQVFNGSSEFAKSWTRGF